jgi:hypothetical protein
MNTKLLKATIGITIVMLLVSACGLLPVPGSRNIITETRSVSGFDHVSISGGGSMDIIQDGSESLTIETDDNVMQYVTSEVRGKTLELGLDFGSLRSIMPSKLHFTLHVKDLGGINTSGSWDVTSAALKTTSMDIVTSGSGNVHIDSLIVDSLNITVSGSGNVNLTGKAKQQSITISGSGKYVAGDLQSNESQVGISGSGNVTVWATDKLTARVSGSGDVKYYGAPVVSFNESGSGNIQSLGTK